MVGTAAAALLLVVTNACGSSQLTISLKLASDLGGKPPFIKIIVHKDGAPEKNDDVHGPFGIDGIPDGEFAPIPPGTKFLLDVIGCPSGTAAECEKSASFNARGCTALIQLTKDEGQFVEVTLHNAVEGAKTCPVRP